MSRVGAALDGLVTRVGGVLVAPRRTLARLAAGEARLGDVVWLLVLRTVAGDAPMLVRAAAVGAEEGVNGGLSVLFTIVGDRLPDLLMILIAGVLLSFFVPRPLAGAPAAPRVDGLALAAYAWVPYLVVHLGGALVFTALGRPEPPAVERLLLVASALWGGAIWLLALLALRSRPPAQVAA